MVRQQLSGDGSMPCVIMQFMALLAEVKHNVLNGFAYVHDEQSAWYKGCKVP